YAGWGQRTDKVAPSLDRVEAVFRQRIGPDPGRSPGIDHAHLDEVETLFRAGEPAARFIDMKMKAGQLGQSGEPGKGLPLRQQVDEDRVELDPGDIAEAEIPRRQDIAAAADSDDRGAPGVADRISG